MFRSRTRFLAVALLLAATPAAVCAQAPKRNVNVVGAQVLPQPPQLMPPAQPRLVPFQPQNLNPPAAVVAPAFAAMPQQSALAVQGQLDGLRRLAAVNALQRRQLAALLQEQLQLAAMQDQLSLWASQPLTPMDKQQLAALQQTLAALQQQNLLQQLAVLQP